MYKIVVPFLYAPPPPPLSPPEQLAHLPIKNYFYVLCLKSNAISVLLLFSRHFFCPLLFHPLFTGTFYVLFSPFNTSD